MIEMIADLAADYVREHWEYNPDTGEFFRIKHALSKGKPMRRKTGTKTRGRVVVTLNGRLYAAHRLAWLMTYNEWPPEQIDHIDCDPYNNKLSNLRLATASENRRNKGLQSNNTSGYKGVGRAYGKWYSRIKVNGKFKHLGFHNTPEAAHAAYVAALPLYHGEFARVK